MFLTFPWETLPTLLREVFRWTLYSSSRPFSSSATRDSSFSTLSMSLFPVLCEESPKIFLTLSIIKVERLIGRKRNRRDVQRQSFRSKVHRVPRRRVGGGCGGGVGWPRAPKSLSKKLRGGGVAPGRARAAGTAPRRLTWPRESASGSTSGAPPAPAICTFALCEASAFFSSPPPSPSPESR